MAECVTERLYLDDLLPDEARQVRRHQDVLDRLCVRLLAQLAARGHPALGGRHELAAHLLVAFDLASGSSPDVTYDIIEHFREHRKVRSAVGVELGEGDDLLCGGNSEHFSKQELFKGIGILKNAHVRVGEKDLRGVGAEVVAAEKISLDVTVESVDLHKGKLVFLRVDLLEDLGDALGVLLGDTGRLEVVCGVEPDDGALDGVDLDGLVADKDGVGVSDLDLFLGAPPEKKPHGELPALLSEHVVLEDSGDRVGCDAALVCDHFCC